MTKEEYKENIILMWDSLRSKYKGGKIDKAIAEIEDYTVEDNCEDGVMFALETIKRCLKEKRR